MPSVIAETKARRNSYHDKAVQARIDAYNLKKKNEKCLIITEKRNG